MWVEERGRGVTSQAKDRSQQARKERCGKGMRRGLERILSEDFLAWKVEESPAGFSRAERSSQYVVTWWLTLPCERGLVEWIIVLGRAPPGPGPGITAFVDDV